MSLVEVLKQMDIDVSREGLTVIDVFTEWCAPCKILRPILERYAEEGRIILISVNLEEKRKIAKIFGIELVPTLVFFKGGKKVDFTMHPEDTKGVVHKIVTNGIMVGFFGEEILNIVIASLEKI